MKYLKKIAKRKQISQTLKLNNIKELFTREELKDEEEDGSQKLD